MEKIESKREFMDTETRDLDDVLDDAFFSSNQIDNMDEDESNYDCWESEYRPISEL